MRHGYIPPHLNFTTLTPNAGEGASRFTIAAEGMAWPAVDGRVGRGCRRLGSAALMPMWSSSRPRSPKLLRRSRSRW